MDIIEQTTDFGQSLLNIMFYCAKTLEQDEIFRTKASDLVREWFNLKTQVFNLEDINARKAIINGCIDEIHKEMNGGQNEGL